jgi:malonyl-CoA O-methyltransferase
MNFDKAYVTYEENAIVQKVMAHKLVAALTSLKKEFDTVLEIGAGTGLLTRELQPKIKFNKYIANDICEKSGEYLDCEFVHCDACELNLESDLLVSNACFQWIEDWTKLPRTNLAAFTTFLPDNLHELRDLTGISLDYKSPEKIKQYFGQILHWEEFEQKLTFENPLKLLAHLKHTGVNSLAKWDFAQVKDFCARCKETQLTYKPVIIVARPL